MVLSLLSHFTIVVGSCFAAMPQLATSCTICIGLPKETAADHLLKSHCVILARQSAGNPFAYAPVETLKGSFDGNQIDLLVDSVTRRRLSIDSDLSVLLVQASADGQWRSLGIVSDKFKSVIRRVVLFAPEWQQESRQARRVEYLFSLFGSEDPSIHELADLELGRAPYAVIRKLGGRIERSDIARMLDRAQYLKWRSLAILLSGHSDSVTDHSEIIDGSHSAETLQLTTNLAAWATAAIEVQQGQAIDFITEAYFSDPKRSRGELEAVITAMSLHGSEGQTHLRKRIISSDVKLAVVAQCRRQCRGQAERRIGRKNNGQRPGPKPPLSI